MFGGAQSVVSLILRGEDQASAAFKSVGSSAANMAGILSSVVVAGALAAVAALAAVTGMAFSFQQDVSSAMNTVEAQTGLTGDALGDFEEQAKDVFLNNWGDSFGDVAASMSTVSRVAGVTGEELEALTTDALIMRDVFGADVPESIRAVDTAMENFGVSGEQAFDAITRGFQETGDPAGDLLDTINEYSADFAEAGVSYEDFIATLAAGAEAGVFNLDKVADSFREGTTRIVDGSKTTRDALDDIGIGADDLYSRIQDGSITTAEALYEAIDALEDMEDPIAQDAAGVALFGSMWEDLGKDAIFALDDIEGGLDNMEGATERAGDAVARGLGPAWESFKRQALVALEPLGQIVADALTKALPYLEQFGAWLGENLPVAIGVLQTAWETYITPLWDKLTAGIGKATPLLDTLRNFFDTVLTGAITVFSAVYENYLAPVWASLVETYHSDIEPVLSRLFAWIGEKLPPVMAWLGDVIVAAWEGLILPALKLVGDFVANTLIPAIGDVVVWLGDNVPIAVQAAADFWNNVLYPALQVVWDFIQNSIIPIFITVAEWLQVNIPIAVEALRKAWEEVFKPALEAVWSFIQDNVLPIFVTMVEWIQVTIPIAVEAVREAWEEVFKPALEAVWQFINESVIPIFVDVQEWLADAIPVAVEAVREAWEEVFKPALELVWDFIHDDILPIFDQVYEFLFTTIPEALDWASSKFSSAWDAIKEAVTTAWDAFGWIFEKIQSFLEWIASNVFDIKINWPQPPQWWYDIFGGGGGDTSGAGGGDTSGAGGSSDAPASRAAMSDPDMMPGSAMGALTDMAAPVGMPVLPTASGVDMLPLGSGSVTYLNVTVNDAETGRQLLRLIQELRKGAVVGA